MPNVTTPVELAVDDGTKMAGHTARPAGGGFPGLIVLQEAFGVNAHIKDMVGRYAAEGYVAIAPELFHRTGPGFEGSYTDFAGVMPHMQALTDEGMGADIRAAYAWLTDQGCTSIGAVGYCMGGRAAFLAAATVPLKAAVSYYGGGIAPGPRGPGLLSRIDDIRCPLMLFWGGLDGHIGPDVVRTIEDALTAGEKDFVNTVISRAEHGFFCDARASYSAAAAAVAWPATLAFLKLHVG